MKKILSVVMVIALSLTSINVANAKKRAESQELEIDYTTLTNETIVELTADTDYQISIINLPDNVSSTKLSKRFSGKVINIRGKREKTTNNSSSHRVKVKTAEQDFEGTVRLSLFEKTLDDSDEDDSDNDNEGSELRSGDNEDNILLETIEFTFKVLGTNDDGSNPDDDSDNGNSQSAEIDYSTLSISSIIELDSTIKSLKFINLPENIDATKLDKNFSGKYVNIRGSREKVTSTSSTHRVKVKKAGSGFEGTINLELYEKITSNSDDDDINDDYLLVESIEFTITISGSSNDDDSNDDD
jgi:hypothetical protein